MNGQDLYKGYSVHAANAAIQVPAWDNLGEGERDAWNGLARKLIYVPDAGVWKRHHGGGKPHAT